MRLISTLLLVFFALLVTGPARAQSPQINRVPLCLQFPDTKTYIPCTGVVPVDRTTGSALDWGTVLKGSSNSAPLGGPAPATAELVAGKDIDGSVKALSVDSSGKLNVNCVGCTGGTGGTSIEQTRRAYWSESTTALAANETFTATRHDNGGDIQGSPTKWNSFSCFCKSDQVGMLNVQASNDNVVWFTVQSKSLTGTNSNVYLSQPMFTKYWRCQIINGTTDQTFMILNAAFGM